MSGDFALCVVVLCFNLGSKEIVKGLYSGGIEAARMRAEAGEVAVNEFK